MKTAAVTLVWLGARTDAIRAGMSVPPSRLQHAFIALELTRCAALGHAAGVMARASQAVSVEGSIR